MIFGFVLFLLASVGSFFFILSRVENGGVKLGRLAKPVGKGLFSVAACAAIFVFDAAFVQSPLTVFFFLAIWACFFGTAYGIYRRNDLSRMERNACILLWFSLAACMLSAGWLVAGMTLFF